MWNRNYFLRFRFRFRLLKSYGSGSNFWKVLVPVPVLVPTFEKLRSGSSSIPRPYKANFAKIFGNLFVFLLCKLFYKEKVYKFQQIYGRMWMKKMLNEGNQMHNFISSSGSRTVINYSSGSGSDFLTSYGSGSCSTSQKVTVPTVPVPVPQRCYKPILVVNFKSTRLTNDLRRVFGQYLLSSYWLEDLQMICQITVYCNDQYLVSRHPWFTYWQTFAA